MIMAEMKKENLTLVTKGNDYERGDQEKNDRKGKFDEYTQLTISRAQIFTMNKNSDKSQCPKQMFHENRDKSQQCDFHEDQ